MVPFEALKMPDRRKPPLEMSGRPEGAPLCGDAADFSVEGTTMRLKLIRLKRREKELLEAHEQQVQHKPAAPRRAPVPEVRPSGRVRHDERGMAVWDWAVATGEVQTLSATSALKKLDATGLEIEEGPGQGGLSLETSGRDQGGGFDPYNQRGSGRRQGEASQRQGVTGAADRDDVLDKLLGKNKK